MKTRATYWAVLLLLVSCLLPIRSADAADPLAIVSVSGIGEALSDVEYLLEATGTDNFAQIFMPQVKASLQGISKDRPLGMVISIENMEIKPLAFIPVDDLDTFLTQMEDTLGEPADAGDGILELQGPQPIFVKKQGNWAFVAQDIDSLDDLPQNPQSLLKGLEKQYDVAVRGFIQNIPDQYRQMIVGQMRQGFEQALEDEEDPNAQKMARSQMEQIERMFQEGDEITFGWNVDPKQKQTFLEATVTAKPGTRMAKEMTAAANVKTKYAGFLVDNAAITANVSGVVVEEQIDQVLASIDGLEQSTLKEIEQDDDIEDENVRATAKELVQGVFKVLRDTVKTGQLDSASSVVLKEDAITIAVAAHVADGGEVEKLLRKVVDMAKSSDDVAFTKLKFNAATHNGIQLHELAVPVPDEEFLRDVVGDELPICIGTSKNDLFVVVGTDPIDNLKKMVDASKTKGPVKASPFTVTVKLAPILKFAQSVDENVEVGGIIGMLEQNGNDHIRLSADTIENGAAYRFTIEEGVLKAIGQAVQMNLANQGF